MGRISLPPDMAELVRSFQKGQLGRTFPSIACNIQDVALTAAMWGTLPYPEHSGMGWWIMATWLVFGYLMLGVMAVYLMMADDDCRLLFDKKNLCDVHLGRAGFSILCDLAIIVALFRYGQYGLGACYVAVNLLGYYGWYGARCKARYWAGQIIMD